MSLLRTTLLTLACGLSFSNALHNHDGASQKLEGLRTGSKKVAVIGAGAGGASAAYHLRQNALERNLDVDITVFERSPYVGGRSTTVYAWDAPNVPIELGASIFVSVNSILVDAVNNFNLSIDNKDSLRTADSPELGIWNGDEFVLQTPAHNGWWDIAKLLWRYGLAPIKTNRLMKSTVGKFLKLYEEPQFPFASLTDAVYDVGLAPVTASTGEQYLKENGIGVKFADEVIQASTRVNYAQNLPLIHGLETMVCMATDGAMAVEGGNWQIFDNMVQASKADVRLNTTVQTISKQADGTYILKSASVSNEEASNAGETFDDIVLATPYQFSSIKFSPEPEHTPDTIPYVRLHVTLFASPLTLSPKAFNLAPSAIVPTFILTTLPPDESVGTDPNGVGKPGFFSISNVAESWNPTTGAPEYIYKIFSPARINSTFLSHILGTAPPDQEVEELGQGFVSWIYRKEWDSYPYEYPRVTFEEIKLDEGLWYTSGIESFISTMETSALMGKNVAGLIVDAWAKAEANGEKKVEGKPMPKPKGGPAKIQAILEASKEREKEKAVEEGQDL
ncbi:Prenylcysteine oxidase [Mytilinidion resinicola]|uniref:Prenylcysteine oxidase n=1 Tax=Mytilinidion resinicola TaxID=574789 RepID=A0A6A6Z275_9PEZI|nr:Prenylcysteine oxidase [Mytilinidion resinicola]KAF2814819.1 Prenylcysteine oxidase [Mytilinidion resinicola]